jgi:hypothetical protein
MHMLVIRRTALIHAVMLVMLLLLAVGIAHTQPEAFSVVARQEKQR